jgi:hypothetical protein
MTDSLMLWLPLVGLGILYFASKTLLHYLKMQQQHHLPRYPKRNSPK